MEAGGGGGGGHGGFREGDTLLRVRCRVGRVSADNGRVRPTAVHHDWTGRDTGDRGRVGDGGGGCGRGGRDVG